MLSWLIAVDASMTSSPRPFVFEYPCIQDKMLKVEKNNENRSLKTNRLFPTANKPDPMPQNLAFLFTKITPEPQLGTSWRSSLPDLECQHVANAFFCLSCLAMRSGQRNYAHVFFGEH